MITIKSRQRKITIDTNHLIKAAQKMLGALKYEGYDLGILLTTNRTIRHFNKLYRGKDRPTDVLSFPFHPMLKPGERIKPKSSEEENLGDLIISLQYVKTDAPRWGQTFEERMIVLLAHGIAHLLGYDHETDEEYALMRKVEQKLLRTAASS